MHTAAFGIHVCVCTHIERLAKRTTGRTLRPRLSGGPVVVVVVVADVDVAVVAIVAAMRHFGHELVGFASASRWAYFTPLAAAAAPQLIHLPLTGSVFVCQSPLFSRFLCCAPFLSLSLYLCLHSIQCHFLWASRCVCT